MRDRSSTNGEWWRDEPRDAQGSAPRRYVAPGRRRLRWLWCPYLPRLLCGSCRVRLLRPVPLSELLRLRGASPRAEGPRPSELGGRRARSGSIGPSWQYLTVSDLTVSDICVARGMDMYGPVKGGRIGGRVALFAFQWCAYIDAHDGQEAPSVLQFSKWAGRNSVTCDRAMHSFRDLFPEHATPSVFRGMPMVRPGSRWGARGLPASASTD